MTPVYELADTYVARAAALHPIQATILYGIPGHDAEMTDYSPAGAEQRAALDRQVAAALTAAPVQSERDRLAKAVMLERLQAQLDQFAAGEHLRALRNIGSPVGAIRQCFDSMPRQTEADWETIATRMERVPAALASFQEALGEGLRRGVVAARRQVQVCVRQAEAYSGQQSGTHPFFRFLYDSYGHSSIPNAALGVRLERAAARATAAYVALGRYLREVYAPQASEQDAVGPERYALLSRFFNGIELDFEETSAWA